MNFLLVINYFLLVIVDRWSTDLGVIFIIFRVRCATIIEDE